MAEKDRLGALGERLAEQHLVRCGMTLLDRNWRCADGEIDLVLRDGDEIVFVEVKTRTSIAFGHPLEAITAPKLARLRRLAGQWCAAREAAFADGVAAPPSRALRSRIRIDAVGVLAPRHAPATVDHLAGVFQ